MSIYRFQLHIAAAVRVRAANETLARKILRSLFSSRGASEVRAACGRFELELEELANDDNAVKAVGATVTDVAFSIARAPTLIEIDGKKVRDLLRGRR